MPRFRFPFKLPVNVAATAVALVVGATSAAAAGHMVLTADAHPSASGDAPGGPRGGEHGPGTTPTTVHREKTTPPPHPTTPTTVKPTTTTSAPVTGDHHEPPSTYPTTSTTRPPEHPTTSTTKPPSTEPHPTTTTTPPPTTATTSPTTSPTTMSLECRTGTMDGQPTAYCWWSRSTAPNFHHYRLTRELVGTPRQEIFTTANRDTYVYLDKGLQPGASYSYIVETYDADGHLIARSPAFHLTCCEAAFPTK
jgi:hypothetical protein